MYDVIIIGAGPAGLTAAIYTGRAKLSTLVIESNDRGKHSPHRSNRQLPRFPLASMVLI